jgi:uncharacterized RDD family membrane protein YckC
MAKLTAGATQDVAVSGLDLVRRQFLRADATVDRVLDEALRRQPGHRPVAPKQLATASTEEVEVRSAGADPRRRMVSGHYAGPVTRGAALAADVFAAVASAGLLGSVTLYLLSILTGGDLTFGSGGWIVQTLGAAWFVVWFWIPVALFGRTVAMAAAGLAVVSRSGETTSFRSAFLRALVLPLSLGFFGLGLIGVLVGRERRALHDVVAGTVVVYDWGERDAERPATIRELLTARVDRRRVKD